MKTIHATCVAIGQRGVLLRGDSGSGKSDLALRLIEEGAMLVADDQVVVTVRDGELEASPPQALAGLIEVRGFGIVRLPYRAPVLLALVVTLVDRRDVPRMPEPDVTEIAGIALPHLLLAPFDASAVAKLRLAVKAVYGAGTEKP
jgi:HPr kinase/phosphorylase